MDPLRHYYTDKAPKNKKNPPIRHTLGASSKYFFFYFFVMMVMRLRFIWSLEMPYCGVRVYLHNFYSFKNYMQPECDESCPLVL